MNIGDKYNMLECVKYTKTEKYGKKFLFKCDCGNEREIIGTYVKNGKYKSCGCMKYNKNKDEDILTSQFGRLKPIKRVENIRRGKAFLCKCECGNEVITILDSLKNGKTKSCGCLKVEVQSKNMKKYNTKHGKANTPEYSVWKGMRERCNNTKHRSYKDYGGRGIKVCERWDNFSNFIEDMGERPTTKHQIDRIDNDGNYEPNNCRWVNRSENSLNKRHPKDSNPHKNVYLKNGKYFVQIKRMQKIVRSKMFDNLDDAISDRERLLKSYDENPECWGVIK